MTKGPVIGGQEELLQAVKDEKSRLIRLMQRHVSSVAYSLRKHFHRSKCCVHA